MLPTRWQSAVYVFGLGRGDPALQFEGALIRKEGKVHGSIRLDLSSKWVEIGRRVTHEWHACTFQLQAFVNLILRVLCFIRKLSAPAPGDGVLTFTYYIIPHTSRHVFDPVFEKLRTSSPFAFRNNPSGEPGACIASFSANNTIHAPWCSHPHQTTEPRLIYTHTTKGARRRKKAGHLTYSAR